MAKKKTETELRKEALVKSMTDFGFTMKELTVLSENTKSKLLQAFMETASRLNRETKYKYKFSVRKWSSFKREDLWREHDKIVNELKYTNIFSDKLFSMLFGKWNSMINTVNPHVTFEDTGKRKR